MRQTGHLRVVYTPVPRLAVAVFGATKGGSGTSCVAGLLAAGLADAWPALPVTLLDGNDVTVSPWPSWLGVRTAAGAPASPPTEFEAVLGLFTAHPWPVAPGVQVQVWSDTAAHIPDCWREDITRRVLQGERPGDNGGVVVLDGPGGQLTGPGWAVLRGAEDASALTAALTATSAAQVVAVLVVTGTAVGLQAAVQLVTDLETTGRHPQSLVVAYVAPGGGVPRAAKARAELLRGRVAAVVEVPYSQQVSARGAVAYGDAKQRQAAAGVLEAVLAAADGCRHEEGAGAEASPAAAPEAGPRYALVAPQETHA